ncbi:hypothetical protein JCM10213_004095 [Rhodosporidiobolus nylandii]
MLSRLASLCSLLTLFLLLGNALLAVSCSPHAARALEATQDQHRQLARGLPPVYVDSSPQGLQKRQAGQAPGAALNVGTANPEPATGDLNQFKVETPSQGNANGGIQAFPGAGGNRLLARQAPAPGAAVELGTSNPIAATTDLNPNDEAAPMKSDPNGPAGMTPFKDKAKRSTSFAHPIPRRDQLNWAPHHLATRGSKEGGIQLF